MIFRFGSNGKPQVIWVGSRFSWNSYPRFMLWALIQRSSADGKYVALWDNRCVLHCATQDHQGLGFRMGWRTISIAEKPFLDPYSMSRRQTRLAKLNGAATTNEMDKRDKIANGTTTKNSDAVNGTIID